jgi:hypothetical protein
VIDLAAMRRATGLTQTELAANLGVGQAQVSKIERQDDMLMSTLANQTEISQRNHRRAVLFFWVLLVGTGIVSVSGNIAHSVLPYIPHVVIQVGTAAVPPIVLLAAVHGIALAVRAGASGTIYRWAVAAVALIGAGAFALSFLALRDLMQVIGYGPATACIFPAIIDTAVAVSTLMLVALADKPACRTRTVTASASAQTRTAHSAKAQGNAVAGGKAPAQKVQLLPVQTPLPVQPDSTPTAQDSTQAAATQDDAVLALELIASGVTTQPVETVTAVLSASRDGLSINAAAKASGINYRTAQRIVEAAAEHRQRKLVAVR